MTAFSVAHAQNIQGHDESPQKGHFEGRMIFSQLNLTDDQKRQLETNKLQHRAIVKSFRQEMRTNREALRVELMKPVLDMSRINVIQSQIKALQAQMEDNRLSSILAVRSILTPEQFLKFVNLMHRHKQDQDHD